MSSIFAPENLSISEVILRVEGSDVDFEDAVEIADVLGSAADGLRWSRQSNPLVAAQRQFWIVEADASTPSGSIRVTVNLAEPALAAEDVARMEAFIARLDAVQPAIKAALAKTLNASDARALSHTIQDIHVGLDTRYWTQLFGRDTQPDTFTAADIVAACKCVALQFNLPGVPRDYVGGTHEAQLDFRFLVDQLIEDDEQAENYLRFGARYDVTDQVIVVRASLDGEIVDIVIES
jgi:hypothetical protein